HDGERAPALRAHRPRSTTGRPARAAARLHPSRPAIARPGSGRPATGAAGDRSRRIPNHGRDRNE
ncbi:hypothetical protein, partial [Streptomyces bohaiensis]|uniref:hypothetical protein n=1 Tax=Streptomyces bohaiensis TaxID=1431344 RepID=UPI0035E3FC06